MDIFKKRQVLFEPSVLVKRFIPSLEYRILILNIKLCILLSIPVPKPYTNHLSSYKDNELLLLLLMGTMDDMATGYA